MEFIKEQENNFSNLLHFDFGNYGKKEKHPDYCTLILEFMETNFCF